MHEPDALRNPTEEQEQLTPLPLSKHHPTFVMGKLTARESEVANLLLKGLSYPKIAKQLNIARRTVKSHVDKMCLRFGIHTCAHPRIALAVLLSKKP